MIERKKSISINKKLLFYVLVTSSLFTVFTTLLNFWMDYNSEKEIQNQSITQIEKSSLKSITKAVWDLDNEQMQRNLNGLMQLHDVTMIRIEDENGNKLAERKKKNSSDEVATYSFHKRFDLVHSENNRNQKIGHFTITMTNYYLYRRLIKKMAVFFVSQGAKTIIVSFILLFIFNFVVTKHLVEFANFLQSIANKGLGDDSKTYAIKRPEGHHPDEINFLINSFNELIQKLESADKKRREEEAQKEAALKNLARLASLGEMAGNIGHEINNPLTIIEGSVFRLKNKQNKDGEINQSFLDDTLVKIKRASERIKRISKSLVLLARGGEDLKYEVTPLGKVMDEVLSLVSEKMKSQNIKFYAEIEDSSFLVKVNQIQIGQVFINLLNNGIHAVAESEIKEISLKAIINQNTVEIRVIDSGHGISKQDAESIFVPFFTTKEVGKGTGLGLSISSKIIKAHGGVIRLETEKERTTFCVVLPRADRINSQKSA